MAEPGSQLRHGAARCADRTVWAGQAGGGSRLKLLIETRDDLDSADGPRAP
jgi:hypothetical protein